MKKTKRKGFNFFRSYYDVYNELENNDKLLFIEALLDRQFLGKKPEDMKGMSKFAYISQLNSIDSQVKGYEDKLKSLNKDVLNFDPWGGGAQGVNEKDLTPTLQEKEKGEVKEEVQDVDTSAKKPKIDFDKLLSFINEQTGKKFQVINQKTKDRYLAVLKEGYTQDNIRNAIVNACLDDYHKETNLKYLKPEYFSRSNTLDLHGFKAIKKPIKHQENPYSNMIENIANKVKNNKI